MKIIAIYSSKGGVGKTSTAVNLAYTAAQSGKKVLLCDMDSQAAASYYFRIKPKKKYSAKKFLAGKISQNIRGTDFENLDLLPAHMSYRNLDLKLDKLEASVERGLVADLLAPLKDEYDLIFLDCPPNLTFLAENIVRAADKIVSPVIPTTLSMLALKQLLSLVQKIGEDKNKVHTFFSMVERRKSMHLQIISQYLKKKIFLKTMIPYSAEVEKMGIYRKPVGAMNNNSAAAAAYHRLWIEICRKTA